AARKRPAVVARDDDKSVFELAQTLQHVEQLASLAVEALHGPIVIADVFAHGFAVRKIRGDADVIEFHSAPDAALPSVLAVRIVAAEPEANRLALRPRVEEGGEILEPGAGGVALASAGFLAAGAPAFSREADLVAGLFEQVGNDGKLGRQG